MNPLQKLRELPSICAVAGAATALSLSGCIIYEQPPAQQNHECRRRGHDTVSVVQVPSTFAPAAPAPQNQPTNYGEPVTAQPNVINDGSAQPTVVYDNSLPAMVGGTIIYPGLAWDITLGCFIGRDGWHYRRGPRGWFVPDYSIGRFFPERILVPRAFPGRVDVPRMFPGRVVPPRPYERVIPPRAYERVAPQRVFPGRVAPRGGAPIRPRRW